MTGSDRMNLIETPKIPSGNHPVRRKIWLLAVLCVLFCLTACQNKQSVTDIPLGEGLPAWEFETPLCMVGLPESTALDIVLEGTPESYYSSSKEELPDAAVYRKAKENGISLEDYASGIAGYYHVMCSMTNYLDREAANITYPTTINGIEYIARSYTLEGDKSFVTLCLLYKTEPTALGDTGLTIGMIRGYEACPDEESPFPDETIYRSGDEHLPEIRISEFDDDYFDSAAYEPALMPGTSKEEFAALSEDGWTEDEIAAFYHANFDVKKEQPLDTNGLNGIFLGFLQDGELKARAFLHIDDRYLLICADDDAAVFQHVVNPMLSTIR